MSNKSYALVMLERTKHALLRLRKTAQTDHERLVFDSAVATLREVENLWESIPKTGAMCKWPRTSAPVLVIPAADRAALAAGPELGEVLAGETASAA